MKRRDFLKTAVAAAPMIISARAFGREGVSPSDKVRVGLIGLGGRCRDIAATCLVTPGIEIAAVCDCLKPRVDDCMKNQGEKNNWKPYTDFREMIEKEKLDGVMVETTTHARAWVTCMAMAAGMDVYIEKPMCLTIAEGREMVNCARKYNRVTQVGTQQRSIPLNNWASDLVKNGAIGRVTEVLAPNFVGPLRWTPRDAEPMPEGWGEEWWDIWTNQAEMRPFHNEIHRGWAKWVDYDGGGLSFGVTGWGTHSYDQIQRGLGTDETGPVEIILEEPLADRISGKFEERQISEDETGSMYYSMAKLTGPRARVTMKFENGTVVNFSLDADYGPGLGCIFKGEKGTIEINRDKVSSNPKELLTADGRPAPLAIPETQPHIENWMDCIKTRKRCNADIEYGQRSSTLCYLINIVRDLGRVGEVIHWDPKSERFANSDEGNAMLSRPRRKGYELPA